MADRIGPIPFIYNAIKEGLSATEALNQYRDLGGQIRTQRFYHAFGEVSAEVKLQGTVSLLPPDAIPTPDAISQMSSHVPGAYLVRGVAFVSQRVVDPQTGKVAETTQVNFGALRMANLATVSEIEDEIAALFGPSGQSGTQTSTVLGARVLSVTELVPVEGE